MALATQPYRFGALAGAFSEEQQRRAIAASIALIEKLAPIHEYLLKTRSGFGQPSQTMSEIADLSRLYPEEFAKRFFFKNIVKCAVASTIYGRHFRNFRRVIDLGTGPGTFLFNFAHMLKNNEFVGIDHSATALELAKKLFSISKLPAPLLIKASLPDAILGGGNFFTASYLLAELSNEERDRFSTFTISRTDAQFLVVDYPEVIRDFQSRVGRLRAVSSGMMQLNLPPGLAEKVQDDKISFGVLYAPSSGYIG